MTTCCGDYHYADCPTRTPAPEPEPYDDDYYTPYDPEPFEGCCEVGDWDGDPVKDGELVTSTWRCSYCGEPIPAERVPPELLIP